MARRAQSFSRPGVGPHNLLLSNIPVDLSEQSLLRQAERHGPCSLDDVEIPRSCTGETLGLARVSYEDSRCSSAALNYWNERKPEILGGSALVVIVDPYCRVMQSLLAQVRKSGDLRPENTKKESSETVCKAARTYAIGSSSCLVRKRSIALGPGHDFGQNKRPCGQKMAEDFHREQQSKWELQPRWKEANSTTRRQTRMFARVHPHRHTNSVEAYSYYSEETKWFHGIRFNGDRVGMGAFMDYLEAHECCRVAFSMEDGAHWIFAFSKEEERDTIFAKSVLRLSKERPNNCNCVDADRAWLIYIAGVSARIAKARLGLNPRECASFIAEGVSSCSRLNSAEDVTLHATHLERENRRLANVGRRHGQHSSHTQEWYPVDDVSGTTTVRGMHKSADSSKSESSKPTSSCPAQGSPDMDLCAASGTKPQCSENDSMKPSTGCILKRSQLSPGRRNATCLDASVAECARNVQSSEHRVFPCEISVKSSLTPTRREAQKRPKIKTSGSLVSPSCPSISVMPSPGSKHSIGRNVSLDVGAGSSSVHQKSSLAVRRVESGAPRRETCGVDSEIHARNVRADTDSSESKVVDVQAFEKPLLASLKEFTAGTAGSSARSPVGAGEEQNSAAPGKDKCNERIASKLPSESSLGSCRSVFDAVSSVEVKTPSAFSAGEFPGIAYEKPTNAEKYSCNKLFRPRRFSDASNGDDRQLISDIGDVLCEQVKAWSERLYTMAVQRQVEVGKASHHKSRQQSFSSGPNAVQDPGRCLAEPKLSAKSRTSASQPFGGIESYFTGKILQEVIRAGAGSSSKPQGEEAVAQDEDCESEGSPCDVADSRSADNLLDEESCPSVDTPSKTACSASKMRSRYVDDSEESSGESSDEDSRFDHSEEPVVARRLMNRVQYSEESFGERSNFSAVCSTGRPLQIANQSVDDHRHGTRQSDTALLTLSPSRVCSRQQVRESPDYDTRKESVLASDASRAMEGTPSCLELKNTSPSTTDVVEHSSSDELSSERGAGGSGMYADDDKDSDAMFTAAVDKPVLDSSLAEDYSQSTCARARGFVKEEWRKVQAAEVPAELELRLRNNFKESKVCNAEASKSARGNRRELRKFRQELLEVSRGSDFMAMGFLTQRRKKLMFAKSRIHGMGLYACEDIPAGEFLIEYVGEVVRRAIADVREKTYERQGMGDSYLFRLTGELVVDATRKGSLARFVNHSCDPSVIARIITVNGTEKIVFYSKRALKMGEELTYDYKFAFEEEDKKVPCFCGASNCRKYLN